MADGCVQNYFLFKLRVAFLRVWSVIGDLKGWCLRAKFVADWHGGLKRVSPLAKNHQRRIDGDAGEPGGETGSAIKILEMNKCIQERILNGVLRIFTVSGDTERGLFEFAGVRLAKRLKSCRLSAFCCCN